MKLYKVTCKGMTHGVDVAYGISYVVAENPSDAYETVKKDLVQRDLGFAKDRELHTIELIAEDVEYPKCGTRLYAALAAVKEE